jgi:hypothetical protein
MTSSVIHPVDPSSEESLADRVARISLLFGLLGPLGFLGWLQDVHWVFEIAEIFYLFFVFFFIPPALVLLRGFWNRICSVLRQMLETEQGETSVTNENDPRSWIKIGYEPGPLKTLQMLSLLVHPTIAIRSLLQIAGAIVAYLRHGGRLPRPETFESTVEYRPPFDGEWTVLNGSPDRQYSHSWFPPRQRYAYDFVITDDTGSTQDAGDGVKSFYCFDEPVLAPASGTVVRVKDGHRDHHRTTGWIDPLQYRLAGNYVVIKHAENEYSFLAHLKQGSICVESGDQVKRGQAIGRCGHSGNSSEPHLHFHLQDHSIPYIGAGLPIQFYAATNHPELQSSECTQTYIHCGQTISFQYV